MFGRDKTSATATPEPAITVGAAKAGGKGRATPSRREAEQRNRRPLVGAPPLRKGASKEERKEARDVRQKAVREERARARQAAANGDERYLNVRDKGPVKRFARDYVDARRNLGEFLLPIAIFSFLIGTVHIVAARYLSLFLLYGAVLVMAIDSFLLRRRVQRIASEKFGGPAAAGVGNYALFRSIQFRRSRNPRPQVKRGEFPAI